MEKSMLILLLNFTLSVFCVPDFLIDDFSTLSDKGATLLTTTNLVDGAIDYSGFNISNENGMNFLQPVALHNFYSTSLTQYRSFEFFDATIYKVLKLKFIAEKVGGLFKNEGSFRITLTCLDKNGRDESILPLGEFKFALLKSSQSIRIRLNKFNIEDLSRLTSIMIQDVSSVNNMRISITAIKFYNPPSILDRLNIYVEKIQGYTMRNSTALKSKSAINVDNTSLKAPSRRVTFNEMSTFDSLKSTSTYDRAHNSLLSSYGSIEVLPTNYPSVVESLLCVMFLDTVQFDHLLIGSTKLSRR